MSGRDLYRDKRQGSLDKIESIENNMDRDDLELLSEFQMLRARANYTLVQKPDSGQIEQPINDNLHKRQLDGLDCIRLTINDDLYKHAKI